MPMLCIPPAQLPCTLLLSRARSRAAVAWRRGVNKRLGNASGRSVAGLGAAAGLHGVHSQHMLHTPCADRPAERTDASAGDASSGASAGASAGTGADTGAADASASASAGAGTGALSDAQQQQQIMDVMRALAQHSQQQQQRQGPMLVPLNAIVTGDEVCLGALPCGTATNASRLRPQLAPLVRNHAVRDALLPFLPEGQHTEADLLQTVRGALGRCPAGRCSRTGCADSVAAAAAGAGRADRGAGRLQLQHGHGQLPAGPQRRRGRPRAGRRCVACPRRSARAVPDGGPAVHAQLSPPSCRPSKRRRMRSARRKAMAATRRGRRETVAMSDAGWTQHAACTVLHALMVESSMHCATLHGPQLSAVVARWSCLQGRAAPQR